MIPSDKPLVNNQFPARLYQHELGHQCGLQQPFPRRGAVYLVLPPSILIYLARISRLFHVQVLCLGWEGQDCSVVAVVQDGDTCDTIADAAGILVSTLLENNWFILSDCSNIYPGEVRRHFHI